MAPSLQTLNSADALVDAGIVSRESSRLLDVYVELLLRWQQRINLIGPSTVTEVWWRHVADSLQLLEFIDPRGECLVDIGSGAGLPGLVLAIAMHNRDEGFAHLVEPNVKKAAFLREAVRATGAPAKVHCVRIESLDSDALCPKPTLVTSRAVAPLPKLVPMVRNFLSKGAVGLLMKGQDVDIELTQTSKYWTLQVETHPSRYMDGGVILKVKEVSSDARSP